MLKVNAKHYLNLDYDNITLHTSGLYAAPENNAITRQNLFETLQAFFKQQPAESFFAVSLMATMSEIIITPLGIADLDKVKQYGNNAKLDYQNLSDQDQLEWPLVVRFMPHVQGETVADTPVSSALELKEDFPNAFAKVWAVVASYLDKNQQLMSDMLKQLITDSHQVKADFQKELSQLNAQQRKAKVGFDLPDNELDQFTSYMSDSHEVMNVVRSAANFVKSELISSHTLTQALNVGQTRTTYYWVLDNTFYQMLYYYKQKYSAENANFTKFLHHHEKQMITQMRQTALQTTQKTSENPEANLKPDMNAAFDHIFMPINEQLISVSQNFATEQ